MLSDNIEDELRTAIARDYNAPDYLNEDSPDCAVVEAVIHFLNEGFMEGEALAAKYVKYLCRNCGSCHPGRCSGW